MSAEKQSYSMQQQGYPQQQAPPQYQPAAAHPAHPTTAYAAHPAMQMQQYPPQQQPYAPTGQPIVYAQPAAYPPQQPAYAADGTPLPPQQIIYVSAGCQHDFVKTGDWTAMDWVLCIFFCPFNFCCCPPGNQEKCRKCGMNNVSWKTGEDVMCQEGRGLLNFFFSFLCRTLYSQLLSIIRADGIPTTTGAGAAVPAVPPPCCPPATN
ncbi:uncharacterized protein EV422DRAFT_522355 [Fimicolochytrium jonesii]|uniref:uncharacterized protein n=1 Tax=Fimicolochytrium jonesii TaxID=1396493 RepID=UPI0022FE1864|nr:uncharacterized protein EV422DRAFT_522355 [Fimicolochytrium jonesii]KAI8823786.1 hypothetical protein EV422DRAFT_522355 [Fimicolochytrium jonesii]